MVTIEFESFTKIKVNKNIDSIELVENGIKKWNSELGDYNIFLISVISEVESLLEEEKSYYTTIRTLIKRNNNLEKLKDCPISSDEKMNFNDEIKGIQEHYVEIVDRFEAKHDLEVYKKIV